MDLFAKGVLQGSVPVIVLVGGTHHLVKKFRESKPVLYWGSLAVATGVAVAIVQGKIPAPFMKAENDEERICSVCGCKEDLVLCCGTYWCNDERCSTKERLSDEPYPKSEESCWAKHTDYGYCNRENFDAETFGADEEEDWEYHVYVSDSPTDDIFIVDNARDFGTKEEAIKAAHEVSKDERGKGKMVYVVAEEREMDIEEVIYRIDEDGDVLGAETFEAESSPVIWDSKRGQLIDPPMFTVWIGDDTEHFNTFEEALEFAKNDMEEDEEAQITISYYETLKKAETFEDEGDDMMMKEVRLRIDEEGTQFTPTWAIEKKISIKYPYWDDSALESVVEGMGDVAEQYAIKNNNQD